MAGYQTTRSALILFCVIPDPNKPSNKTIKALFGVGNKGITTIGGRSGYQEQEYSCLMRECEEETKELITFSLQPDFFAAHPTHKTEKFAGCLYVFMQTTENNLLNKVNEFSTAKTSKNDSDELAELVLEDIDELICDIIEYKKKRVNPDFSEMFLSIGYDIIKGNEWNKLKAKLGIEFDNLKPLDLIPTYVSLLPFCKDEQERDLLPVIYGFNTQRKLYLSDQFYTRVNNKYVFRSGIISLS